MAKEFRRRYAINFDLSIEKLREHYSKTHPKKAYTDIKQYMLKQGFTHRQWSGYVSEKTMSRPELAEFTVQLHEHFPWLIECEGRMDATVITDIFDIRQMIVDLHVDEEDMSLV